MAKRLRKRAISIVLMLTMVFTLFPTTAINAYAAEDIEEYSLFAEQQEELVNDEDTDYSEYEDEQENEESVEVLESEMSLLGTTYSSSVYINALATGDIIEPTAMVQGVGTEFNVYIDDVLVNSGYQWINQGGTYTVSSISENSGVYSLYLVSDARTFVNFSMVMCNMPEEYDFTTLPEGVTFSGTWNSDQHGYRDFTITVPVDGPVRFTIGDCRYAKNAIPVKNNANETITTLSFPASGCYGPTTTGNVFQYIYTGGADTLKFDSIQYCNYFAAEAVDYVEVTGVSLNTSAETLTVGGDAATLTATIEPAEATDKTVKWSVDGTNADAVKLYSDADCTTGNEIGTDATETLTVYAKGISAGSATVTVTSNADSTKCASCEVTVNAGNTTFNPASTYTGFGNLISNDTEVNISEVSGKTWYVIAYDDGSSTVTLLSKEGFGNKAFNSVSSGVTNYATSDIKTYVDGLTGEGQPLAGISSVISDLTLIDEATADNVSVTKRKGAGTDWWLCSLGTAGAGYPMFVYGGSGAGNKDGGNETGTLGVRPALK